jgi:hypothetical protein
MRTLFPATTLACLTLLGTAPTWAANVELAPVSARFANREINEIPSFQKHVVPLFGRLGCNGRACHGSFQGRGGFQLSLFGYDFQSDHQALFDTASPRVDVEDPAESLILVKPTDEDLHEGGLRYTEGSWQYHLFRRWIEQGAPFLSNEVAKIKELKVTPSEIQFEAAGQQRQLRAVAVWEDGTREDVTCLCRFRSNDEQIARIDETGLVAAHDKGDTHVVVFYDNAVVPIPVMQPVSALAGENYPNIPTPTRVDELVVGKLRKLGIIQSDLCSDMEFLRRVSLDITGTLPTPDEVEQFLADTRPDKRSRKIDHLLDTHAYAAWWTTQLCDYTGNNETALINIGPVRGRESQDWYDWIYQRVDANQSYDELVAGIVLGNSRQPGESYLEYCRDMSDIYRGDADHSFAERKTMPYFWARRNLRLPEEKAIGFAYAFLGIRIQCAQCHKHPFDQWSKQDFDAFKTLFTRVALNNGASRDARTEYDRLVKDLGLKGKRGNELRRELPKLLKQGKTVPFSEVSVTPPRTTSRGGSNRASSGPTAKILGGEKVRVNQVADPRAPLMEWLRDEKNPYFARAFVNRVWTNYFNVGIVDPPDDLSLANPPSNKPLLDYLTEGFVASGYDMKWLHREITNSRSYQLSWITNSTNAKDETNFSHAVPRRLAAEVVYDAIRQATASARALEETHSELEGRAIAIAGTGARNSNRGAQYALTVFGRSTRASNCDCDRSSEASLLQTVFLQNDNEMLALLERPRDGWISEIGQQERPVDESRVAAARAQVKRLSAARQTLQKRISRLGDQPTRQAAAAKRQMEKLEKQLSALRQSITDAEQAAKARAPDLQELVRQAYLRTLSRLPREDEQEIARQYIQEAETTADGLRDLLWALLNTKEFIVNH